MSQTGTHLSAADARRDIYQDITNRIIAALESAQRWQKPWTSAFTPSGDGVLRRPVNAITKKPYRGINVPILWSTGRVSNCWATYKAWSAAGAQVRKGEKGTMIVFWKEVTRASNETTGDGETGDERRNKFWMARGYIVFNSEQVEGWSAAPLAPQAPQAPPAPKPAGFEPIPVADAFIAGTGAVIKHGGDSACYIPALDLIKMPERSQFKGTSTSSAYYSTILHELGHFSGAKGRCDRDLTGRFGSEAYSVEELIAELTSAYLCADLNVSMVPRPDHGHYIASWLKVLRNDKRAVFTAASKAEQATRFLHALQPHTAVVSDDLADAA
jgi:antirestriction protein ArdC